jgi:hypothetical protein
MSLPTAALRLMLAKGLSLEDAVEIFEAIQAEQKPRSAGAERTRRWRERKSEASHVTSHETSPRDVTGDGHRDVTAPPVPLDKEIPPAPPKEINPPDPDTHAHSARASAADARQRLAEVREAAGDALASMATAPGIASLAQLVALTSEIPACDWELDILPAITTAAAWHRAQDGPGSMRSWTVAVKIARQNRTARLNPPAPSAPVRLDDVRKSQSSSSDRQARYVERLSPVAAAMAAAVEQSSG